MVAPLFKRAAVALALSATGAAALIAHEGWVKVGYKDPVGIPTACAGHTRTAKVGKIYTEAECLKLLREDVAVSEAAVKRLVTVHLTQDQFNALVSFTFNVGEGNLVRSTLLRKLNAGDCVGAANEFLRWDRAAGKRLPGLTKRRADERAIFIKGCHVPHQASLFAKPPATPLPPARNLPAWGLPTFPVIERRLVASV